MTLFELSTPTWTSGPLLFARTRRVRRIGLLPLPGPFGMLMWAGSVHTFGMVTPIGVVFLGPGGLVLSASLVAPGRIRWARTAIWVAETGAGSLPRPGETAVVRPILAGWPAP